VSETGGTEDPSPVAAEQLAQFRRLGTALRRVNRLLMLRDAPPDRLARMADLVEAFGDELEAAPRGQPIRGPRIPGPRIDWGPERWTLTPMSNVANPIAPPVEILAADEAGLSARVRFGPQYEGPPGCVHGGYLAAAFDEVAGLAQAMVSVFAMTVRLTVNYRSPAPLETELAIRAWVDRVDGRKVYGRCELHAGERLCCDAEILFIRVGDERFAALVADDEERRRDDAASGT
jgi:acyl-coenzyme A thioesterase PaaI-like protein